MEWKTISKEFLVIFIIFAIIDITGINILTKDKWERLVFDMTGKLMNLNYFAAFASYILLAIGLYIYGYKNINPANNLAWESIKWGVLFGLVVYGVFDFTNMGIFNDSYNWTLGFVDIAWGSLVSVFTLYIGSIVLQKI